MKTTRTLIAILGAAFLAMPVFAAETVLTFEPAGAEIHWTLDTLLHMVHGTFQLKSGFVSFDPDTGKASGQLIVSAASGESGSKSRDERMHKSILESAKFPEIVFTPDRVEGTVPSRGTATVQVHGSFKLLGANHEMTVPLELDVEPLGTTVKAKFPIPYVQWGLKNPSTLMLRVSEKVNIEMHAVGKVAHLSTEAFDK